MSAAAGALPAVESPLDRGRLKGRLTSGDPTFGTFVGTASAVTAEVCAAAGVDWVLLDLEHGAGGEEQVRSVVPAAAAYGVPTVVRVESPERIRVGRVLDLGAAGVMLPRMDSAAAVRDAVRHLRYPPLGDRGAATYNRACRFGLDVGALDRADDDVVAVVQIETTGALEQVEEIAALDAVDVLFVGPLDLSFALGVPRDTHAAVYARGLERVQAAAQRHGVATGILVGDGAAAANMRADGWTFVAIGSDSTLLAATLATHLATARPATA